MDYNLSNYLFEVDGDYLPIGVDNTIYVDTTMGIDSVYEWLNFST